MVSVPMQVRAEFSRCICIMYIVALDSLPSPQSCELYSYVFCIIIKSVVCGVGAWLVLYNRISRLAGETIRGNSLVASISAQYVEGRCRSS